MTLRPLHYRLLAGRPLPPNVSWNEAASAVPDVTARNTIDEVSMTDSSILKE